MDDVIIVGPCSAGKSTLTRALRQHGYQVRLVAQEHSGVPNLWRRLPARALIYLDVDLEHIHQRGRSMFNAWILSQQRERLRTARAAADLYVDTNPLAVPEVLQTVLDFLNLAHITPSYESAN